MPLRLLNTCTGIVDPASLACRIETRVYVPGNDLYLICLFRRQIEKSMNGGTAIAKALHANNVRYLFTLCGGHIAPIYVEAERAGIRVIDVRHEATAVFAADVMARLSGVPGVAAVTAGPGVTNAVTALKNAQMAQSPVILIGGATATLLRGRGALQDIDQTSILHSVVKWSVRVERVREIGPTVREAFKRATSGVPGPVFIECPVDLLFDDNTVREWYGQKNEPGKTLLEKLQYWYIRRHLNHMFSGAEDTGTMKADTPVPANVSEGTLRRALDLICRAEKPLLIAGSGAVMIPGAVTGLSEAIRRLGIPTYLSGMARGLLGAHDPVQFIHQRKKALREADCIILAGVPADFRLDYGRQLNRKARKIAVNRHRCELKKNLSPDLAVQADPGQFLIALARHQTAAMPVWENWKNTLNVYREEREKEISGMASEVMEGINPLALFRTLESRLPDNSVIIADGGDFAATASYTLSPRKPLSWLDPGVFGTLGVGGGFALAAALHYPDNYIWIIYGDGSAAYSLAEFDIFTRHGMKVCAIIGNNGSWEQIARDQRTMLGADTATQLPQSDYQHIAEAFGAAGERVDTLETFSDSIARAKSSMDNGIPYIINALIGKSEFRKGSISI